MFSIATPRRIALALLLGASGCSNMAKPGPQSVVGMSPDATISMTEIMAVGAEGGKGTLNSEGTLKHSSWPRESLAALARPTLRPLEKSTICATFLTSKVCIPRVAVGWA
jgi:hypothetical protein